MGFKDLREWVDVLEREGQVSHVNTEVNWNLELGGIVAGNFRPRQWSGIDV